ncbi:MULTISPECIES: DUF397 domain-containing protein [unclassified Streptomyces]|uniref:DUF397 domain-containing protein n=1 Tax=unclassified Streptomyces TaxID=2593676 RepID=UPI003828EF1B
MTIGINLTGAHWAKSSYSSGGDNCVEVASANDTTGIRDSKAPHGPLLTFPTASFTAFLGGIKSPIADHDLC